MKHFLTNLCVQFGLSDEIDNPFFGVGGLHVQFVSQHWNGNTLMNATESFENHETRIFNEIVSAGHQKEVRAQDCIAFTKFLLSTIEVKIDVKIFNEWCNGIFVSVWFFLDHFDQIEHNVASGTLVDDNCGGQVPEKCNKMFRQKEIMFWIHCRKKGDLGKQIPLQKVILSLQNC